MIKTWRFEALDSWFFRESRPHGSMGDSELGSVYPPPPRTVAGAVRFLMGETIGIDWAAFGRGDGTRHRLGRGLDLRREIGLGDDLGRLRLGAGRLARLKAGDAPEHLFPAPGCLVARRRPAGPPELYRLRIGDAAECDLGRVRLPVVDQPGARPLKGVWLTRDGLSAALQGSIPEPEQLVESEVLFREEPRLGIGRENSRRTAKQGLLYQCRHIRPAENLVLEVSVTGADHRLLELARTYQRGTEQRPSAGSSASRFVRFGGEGRLAAITIRDGEPPLPAAPSPGPGTQGLILCLLTAADLGDSWLPPGFEPRDHAGITIWHGELSGIPLALHSAALGKPVREGGWDLARRSPRPVQSLMPAGSAWYCTVRNETPLSTAITELHGIHIGEGTALGRGQLAVGLWQPDEITNTEDSQP